MEAAVRADLGEVLGRLGKFRESAEQLRLAIPLLESTRGRGDERTIVAISSLSNALGGMELNKDALEQAQESLARSRRAFPPGHPRALSAMNNAGAALHALGRADEAISLLREGLALAERDPVGNAPVIADMLSQLSAAEIVLEDKDAALEYALRNVRHVERHLGAGTQMAVATRNNALNLLVTAKRFDEAADMARGLIPLAEKVFPPEHPSRAYAYASVANALAKGKHFDEAERYALDSHCIIATSMGDSSWSCEQAASLLCTLYESWGDHRDELKRWSVQAVRIRMMLGAAGELDTTLKTLVPAPRTASGPAWTSATARCRMLSGCSVTPSRRPATRAGRSSSRTTRSCATPSKTARTPRTPSLSPRPRSLERKTIVTRPRRWSPGPGSASANPGDPPALVGPLLALLILTVLICPAPRRTFQDGED